MSDVMSKIEKKAQKMNDALQRTQRIADSASPGQNFEDASSWIDKARRRISDFVDAQRGAADGAEEVKSAWEQIKTVVGAAAIAAAVKQVTSAVQACMDAFNTQTQYEVQLAVVMGNNGSTIGQIDEIIGKASELQKATTFGDEALIGGAAELATYVQDTEAIETLMGTLTNYAAGMGGPEATPEQMVEYATQLGKALNGTYDGLLKKGFELTDAQKAIIDNGTDMEKALVLDEVIAESWANLAESYANTPEGKILQFKNAWGDVTETIGGRLMTSVLGLFDALNSFMSSDAASWIIDGVCSALNIIIGVITVLIGAIQSVAEWVQANWAVIQPILIAIASVYLVSMIAKLWAAVTPILAQAAAWAVANAPLVLMIGLIALLIAALMDAGVTVEDIVGFVGGLLGGLYAFGYNLIADTWNFIATFAEFFANVFVDPIGSVKRLFLGLADSVLGVIETIANAIDAVFGSSLADTVGGWRAGLQGMIEDTYGEGTVKIERMEKIDTATTAASWSTGAKNIASSVSDLASSLYDTDLTSFMNVDSVGGVESVDSVGSVDEDINIAEEDLKFLKDVAEMRYVQNFVTLTPSVAVDAKISEKVDIDEVVGEIERKLETEFEAAAEGVYA